MQSSNFWGIFAFITWYVEHTGNEGRAWWGWHATAGLKLVTLWSDGQHLKPLYPSTKIIKTKLPSFFAVIHTTCTCHLWSPRSVISSSSSLLQWWTQRAWRHHLDQRPEDLISDWCQCCHQEGRHLESSCAPWKWGCHPHGYPHGDRPLTLHISHHRSWSYVLLITSGPYIGGGGGFYWHTLSLWPKASGATHPGKFWLCLERNDRADALKAVLYFVFHVCFYF